MSPQGESVRFLAHSPVGGVGDAVIDHLQASADLAALFAQDYAAFEARVAALLHDIAKYGTRFQRRLQGLERHIDHWSLGAWIALKHYRDMGIGPAMAIQGHHIGLQSMMEQSLRLLNPQVLVDHHPLGLILSTSDERFVLDRFHADGGHFPTKPDAYRSPLRESIRQKINTAAMLDVRMLFSAVVDADFLTTEAHFNRKPGQAPVLRAAGARLDADRFADATRSYSDHMQEGSTATAAVRQMRRDLQDACTRAGQAAPGLFTLTAPTGSGKTLATLRFALEHARKNHLRRIIVVLPFLSLIEQTADVYRHALGLRADDPLLLEDHSLADEDSDDGLVRLLAQNWDAPVIITTTVRFFESLFANRPAACRKLHNVVRSVVILDEAQSLPLPLVPFTLAALSHLQSVYGTSIVVSTATQPAFTHLAPMIASQASAGWTTQEIVPPRLHLFERTRRVRVHWPRVLDAARVERTTWDDVAATMLAAQQVGTIVNLKRQCRALYDRIAPHDPGVTFHVSTDMCPAHRRDVLETVRTRLAQGLTTRVVSTQCIEAGVDLDFPTLLRIWGPLDALAQAAGRCNREGRQPYGDVRVFLPPIAEERYPDPTYANAAAVTKRLFLESGGDLDLQDTALYTRYYRDLYDIVGLTDGKVNGTLAEHIQTWNFVETARAYRLIPRDTINVLVPYSRHLARYRALRADAEAGGFGRQWVRQARALSVSLYRAALHTGPGRWLEPVRDRTGLPTGWFVYLREEHYSDAVGLVDPEMDDVLIV